MVQLKCKVLLLAFAVVVAASVVLAVPMYKPHNGSHIAHIAPNNTQASTKARVRRDMTGVFDSVANAFEGVAKGISKISASVAKAFNDVFSKNNVNAVTDGFTTFGRGIKDAFGGLFGEKGEVTKGFKNIGDKIAGAFKGDSDSKGAAPSGKVPQEETT